MSDLLKFSEGRLQGHHDTLASQTQGHNEFDGHKTTGAHPKDERDQPREFEVVARDGAFGGQTEGDRVQDGRGDPAKVARRFGDVVGGSSRDFAAGDQFASITKS